MSLGADLILLLIYLAGGAGIFLRRKKQTKRHTLLYLLGWSVVCVIGYTLKLEFNTGTYFLILPLVFSAVFAVSYFHEKRRLINGLLFNLFLFSLALYMTMVMFRTEDRFLVVLAFFAVFVMLGVALFGVYVLLGFLYWNGLTVLRKESLSLGNLLTLLLGIALTVYFFVEAFLLERFTFWAREIFAVIPALMMYFFIVFLNFLTVSLLYQFNRPRHDQDYIIVLGAGLLGGEKVTPLLAKRIDKAIQFYRDQVRMKNHPPTLLMSGGKGSDEKISEAEAMRQYALEQGIPDEDILTETNSVSTLENMQFSKEIMEGKESGPYKVIFASSNYHIFRAGLYAREAHLKADGIGARTAGYFLPNAFLREFIAIIILKKRRHLLVCGLIVLGMLFLALANAFLAG